MSGSCAKLTTAADALQTERLQEGSTGREDAVAHLARPVGPFQAARSRRRPNGRSATDMQVTFLCHVFYGAYVRRYLCS